MKSFMRERVKWILAALLSIMLVSSCATASKVGQSDTDRINGDEQMFNRDMQNIY